MRTKGKSKPNPKASSIAVPLRSNLANEAEAGLGNHPEVYDPPVLNAVNLVNVHVRLRNQKLNLVKASGTGHTRICVWRKRSLLMPLKRC